MTTLHNPPTPQPPEGQYMAERIYANVWRCAFRVNNILWFTLAIQPSNDDMVARALDAERFIASGDQLAAMADAVEHLQRAVVAGAATMPAEALKEIRRACQILMDAGAEQHIHRDIARDEDEETFVPMSGAQLRALLNRISRN